MRRWVLGTLLAFSLSAVTAVAANLRVDGKLISTEAAGPPLEVDSTSLVSNLNADMVDGLHGEDLVTHFELDDTESIYRQIFLEEAGDYVFTVPAGVSVLDVTIVGGGGGGGNGGTGPSAGGGGGGSGYVLSFTFSLVADQTELAMSVGAGGAPSEGGGRTIFGAFAAAPFGDRLEARGGEPGADGGPSAFECGAGGSGWFGGGGSSIAAEGQGHIENGDEGGASGGEQGTCTGGGGGPGGGNGAVLSGPGEDGEQPGAGGGGGADDSLGGSGADGSILIRWVGPAAQVTPE